MDKSKIPWPLIIGCAIGIGVMLWLNKQREREQKDFDEWRENLPKTNDIIGGERLPNPSVHERFGREWLTNAYYNQGGKWETNGFRGTNANKKPPN